MQILYAAYLIFLKSLLQISMIDASSAIPETDVLRIVTLTKRTCKHMSVIKWNLPILLQILSLLQCALIAEPKIWVNFSGIQLENFIVYNELMYIKPKIYTDFLLVMFRKLICPNRKINIVKKVAEWFGWNNSFFKILLFKNQIWKIFKK